MTSSSSTPPSSISSTTITTSGSSTTTTSGSLTTVPWPTTNKSNLSDYDIIKAAFNLTDLYVHQNADFIEATHFSVRGVHALIWTITILTYLVAIPMVTRMVRSKFYQNIIDYFSFHLIICAFIAWIPTLIFLLYYWSQVFTLRLCRLHYVILSTNETVSSNKRRDFS